MFGSSHLKRRPLVAFSTCFCTFSDPHFLSARVAEGERKEPAIVSFRPRNIKPFVAFLLQAEGSHFSLHFFFSMATTWHPPRFIHHASASCCCQYQLKLGNGLRSLFQRWLYSAACTSSVDLKDCWKLPATMAPSLTTAQPVTPWEWIPVPGHQLPLRLGESKEPLCPGTLRLHFRLSNICLSYRLLELITPQDGLSLSHAYPFFFVHPSWPWPAFI